MLTKRIIPCLDVMNGRTVKGVNFVDLRDAGDVVELGARYAAEGADELVFLDITATQERRKTLTELVRNVAAAVNIPFTVGGGIGSIEDVRAVLMNGADKVSVNSAAVKKPQLITDLAKEFGSQCVVLAVDVKYFKGEWLVYLNGGKVSSGRTPQDWIREAVDRGAGEILLTSMYHDGTKMGFAVELTREIAESVPVPVIASGGAGKMQDFADVFLNGKAEAALAASIFHFGEIGIADLKNFLRQQQIPIRI